MWLSIKFVDIIFVVAAAISAGKGRQGRFGKYSCSRDSTTKTKNILLPAIRYSLGTVK